eukprot:TRINITY_DN13603_c0_g2_i1.p1 TRINITY_DN13603_c0_g2~~TRINITY_DN13603_c0_g2_i1.p1  ORF type:complete len:341 (+),score=40.10 TRINITY_DN13603_c0_g2_i1:121-1143(+)
MGMEVPTGGEARDDVSLLIVLLEANPFFWAAQGSGGATAAAPSLGLPQLLTQFSFFVNSFLALHDQNQLAVIATGASSCQYLYLTPAHEKASTQSWQGGSSRPSTAPSTSAAARGQTAGIDLSRRSASPIGEITQALQAFSDGEADELRGDEAGPGNGGDEVSRVSLLSGSLSLALSCISKSRKGPPPHPHPRILCLHGSPDAPQQYIAVMNVIFSAQRSGVPIDTCMLGAVDSPFLQQAAYLTGGVYLKPRRPEGLLQYMMMVAATDLHSRRFLELPRPTGVDFRASCFCHKKTIDSGWVCSVCLSIYCKQTRACATCGATFGKTQPSAGVSATIPQKV